MKKMLFAFLLLSFLKGYSQTTITQKQYKEDFDFFWQTINDNYCYFQKKQIDWVKVKGIYSPMFDTVSSRASFIALLEKAIYELYDHHCGLKANNESSRRLVPTGADMWAAFVDGKPVIQEVRKGFGAEKMGIMAGMEVVAVNGVPVNEAIQAFLPYTVNEESKSFALRLVLAGDHITERKITLKSYGVTKDYYPDRDSMQLEHITYRALVESTDLGQIGYIKVNNFLFDNAMIPAFDSVLNTLLQKKAIIIDMRETPSGGNTAVARAILGRFITKEQFYQKHELYSEEKETGIKRSWEEIVSPRGATFTGKLVVLADHWTGSVSEGITIGFDGLKRATVIGTQMAALNGAVEDAEMPNTKISFGICTERLFHVNGTPREFYKPTILVSVTKQTAGNNGDVILKTAMDFLKKQFKQ